MRPAMSVTPKLQTLTRAWSRVVASKSISRRHRPRGEGSCSGGGASVNHATGETRVFAPRLVTSVPRGKRLVFLGLELLRIHRPVFTLRDLLGKHAIAPFCQLGSV